MNRQQRRLNARRIAQERAFEEKYWKDIVRRQNTVEDTQVGLHMVCIALALNKIYGWKERGIERVIREYHEQICRIDKGETLEDLAKELEDKTDIVIGVLRGGQ